MLKSKFVTAGMALVLAAALGGCSGNSNDSSGSNTAEPGNSAGSEDTSPVTYKYFSFGAPKKQVLASETTIGKELQTQTGVDWNIEYLVGDGDTKAGVMIASGDYPDIIDSSNQMAKLMDAGAFIPLDDLIDKYGPNIKRVYGPYFDKFRQEDGKIYFFPYDANIGYVSEPNFQTGFYIQRSVLKEFNYPTIKTLDEYFDLIKQYKDKYPQVDGQDTIGFATFAGEQGSFFTLQNPANHLAGYPNDGSTIVDMETHEAKLVGGSDYQKRWIKKLNEANGQGLVDPESFTMNRDQYLAKLTSGRVLGYFSYSWQVGDATNNLKKAGNDDKRYVALPIVFDKEIKDQYIDPPGFVNNYGVGITVNAKDPERIIKYFDNLLKEENQILVQWGVKDQSYTVDENGRFTYANDEQRQMHEDPEKSTKFGFDYFNYSWPRYGNNSVLEDGNAYGPGNQPEVASYGYTEGDKELLAKYGVQTFSELFSAPDARPWSPAWSIALEQGSPEQMFITKADDLQRKYLPTMILDNTANFDKNWDEYMGQFNKLDKKTYEDFITKKVQERVAGNW
ncbi:ABC transporter substrate-binding protein [Paenibacillus sp. FSL R7-0273]|uniref:ABC transporter substrate-binding protein n=1 Tax=Paenibacillus sp. FSL R7-0273 TaxID=1536772 RepID=UPI0004F82742|nr:ABC transporter substrate-binding protein [Paenibacillus sp. FSL R7-0273]AIQ47397.1 ABC transporter substrate-binding protein [Paenibacillus sp. FSL R7-0273]OMF96049.1 ABC transporter substrate-binding protein [Paenibacillus sp. FSL R7-0273]